MTLDAARRHSRRVRVLRVLLALAMAGVAASVGYYVAVSAINPPPVIEASAVDGDVRMVNPRFTSRDCGGAPCVISAESAQRVDATTDVTELAFPRLDFTAQEAAASIIRADRGVFDQVARTLDLHDGVSFRTDTGYTFETEHARVYVDEGRVVGERIILGEGPMGSIRAQSFEITSEGDRVIFRDQVVARLYPDQPNTPELRGDAEETDLGPAPPGAVAEAAAPGAEPEAGQADEAAPAHARLSRQGGPIDLTADATEFISSQNVNRWIGHVNVRQGDAQLSADEMDVYFAESDDEAREIERIEAMGSVAYVTPLEVARGDRGVYLASTERITLTGDVSLIRGDSTLSGDQLVIEPREGRSSLTREAPDASDGGGRVRGVLGGSGGGGDPASASPSGSD